MFFRRKKAKCEDGCLDHVIKEEQLGIHKGRTTYECSICKRRHTVTWGNSKKVIFNSLRGDGIHATGDSTGVGITMAGYGPGWRMGQARE